MKTRLARAMSGGIGPNRSSSIRQKAAATLCGQPRNARPSGSASMSSPGSVRSSMRRVALSAVAYSLNRLGNTSASPLGPPRRARCSSGDIRTAFRTERVCCSGSIPMIGCSASTSASRSQPSLVAPAETALICAATQSKTSGVAGAAGSVRESSNSAS